MNFISSEIVAKEIEFKQNGRLLRWILYNVLWNGANSKRAVIEQKQQIKYRSQADE